jgi:hypothetical protein
MSAVRVPRHFEELEEEGNCFEEVAIVYLQGCGNPEERRAEQSRAGQGSDGYDKRDA